MGFQETYSRVGIEDPFDYQREVWQAIRDDENVLVSAGTGSGKTEAALLPALSSGKRVIILYPTKALLQDQKARVARLWSAVHSQTPEEAERHIAVDTGDEDDVSYYHADVILTNLDKFLYRMFGYGKKRFSYLFPYRIAGRDSRDTVLIFDEAHAYEQTIFSHFWFVLKKLTYERRAQSVLLSATLPSKFVLALRDQERRYFPRPVSEGHFFHVVEDKEVRTGQVSYAGSVPSGEDAIAKAWYAYRQGKRVIVVVRRVVRPQDDEAQGNSSDSTLQQIWERLIALASEKDRAHEVAKPEDGRVVGSILTYHGHQLSSYRRLVLERLKELDDAREPYLLVTTSAMEVGVDVSCNVMITDFCEPDSFVQRIGRCARRKGEKGQVHLVEATAPARTAALRDYFRKLTPGTELTAERKAELNAMNAPPQLDTVHLRLEYVQDVALHRYIYDFVQENKAMWQRGVLVTREWEPCIPVVRSEPRDGDTYIGGLPEREFWRGKELKEKTLLPVSCAADIAPFCAWIFDTFNSEFHHPQRVPVGGKQQRTLKDTLLEAGYSAGSDENKTKPQYAVGFPLVLLLGNEVSGHVFRDDNFGFAYTHQFVKPTVAMASTVRGVLRARQVELRKDKGQVRLPLYWYEPVKGGETS